MEEELRQYFEKQVSKVHADARLISYKAQHLDDNTRRPVFEVVYEVPGYALTAGGKILAMHFPEVDYTAWGIGMPIRAFPLWWGDKDLMEKTVVMTVPEGFRVYHVPKSQEIGVVRLGAW